MKALERYPYRVNLNDDTEVALRPLRKQDKAKLFDFFTRLPLEDRVFLRDEITDRALVESWVENLNFELVLPIVAEYQDAIVGDITLHHQGLGWRKHLCDVRVVVDREFQRKGLASVLIKDIVTLATDLGLEKLVAEIPLTNGGAIRVFNRCGFQGNSVLSDFVKDQQGNDMSIAVMVYDLRTPKS